MSWLNSLGVFGVGIIVFAIALYLVPVGLPLLIGMIGWGILVAVGAVSVRYD